MSLAIALALLSANLSLNHLDRHADDVLNLKRDQPRFAQADPDNTAPSLADIAGRNMCT
jgi:hypothetical protein